MARRSDNSMIGYPLGVRTGDGHGSEFDDVGADRDLNAEQLGYCNTGESEADGLDDGPDGAERFVDVHFVSLSKAPIECRQEPTTSRKMNSAAANAMSASVMWCSGSCGYGVDRRVCKLTSE